MVSDLTNLQRATLALNAASALHQQGKYDLVITNCDQALTLDPDDRSGNRLLVLNQKGLAFYELNRSAEALQCFEDALRIKPTDVAILINATANLGKLGRWKEGMTFIDRALAIQPKNALALGIKALALVSLSKTDEALSYCDQALAIDPNEFWSKKIKAQLAQKRQTLQDLNDNAIRCMRQGNYEEASQFFDKYVAADDKNAMAWAAKASCVTHLKQDEETIRCCDKALTLGLGNQLNSKANTLFLKGSALYRMEKYEEALTSFNEALEIEPENANFITWKGMSLANLKDRDTEALACLEKALEMNPRNANALGWKAFVLFGLSLYDEAIRCSDEALAIDPSEVNAHVVKGMIDRMQFR